MQKIAFFDCFAGISGDMTLGALVDLGLNLDELSYHLDKLHLSGFKLEARPIQKHAISGTKVNVIVSDENHPHRHLSDIRHIIESSELSPDIKEKAHHIFKRIAEVEATIHGTTLEKIHFHEVGAIDAIVDITGVLIGIELLGIEKIFSTPVHLGTGTTKSMHGIIPVPAPATLGLLVDFPVVKTQIPSELTTPTGAALITTLAQPVTQPLELVVEKVGYGAGQRNLEEIPNMLRILLGRKKAILTSDEVLIVESNIDDMNPEVYPYVIDKLIQAGALDVFLTPIIMKKGRPAIMISILTDHTYLQKVISILYQETSTLGLRIHPVSRQKLPRTTEKIQTPFGEIAVKVAFWEGKKRYIPEFEVCKKIAEEKGIPLKSVYERISKTS